MSENTRTILKIWFVGFIWEVRYGGMLGVPILLLQSVGDVAHMACELVFGRRE